MRVLEVRHLEMVAAICETRSVGRAAAQLNLSQPALSHALRNLEDRLGVRLFDRTRRMTPTAGGVELRDAAARILVQVRDAEARLARHKGGGEQLVRVATECYTCYHWLPAVFKRMRATMPQASVQIVAEAMGRPVDALLSGELDLALLHDKPRHRRLVTHRLFVDELVLITSPDHRLAHRKFVVPADIASERLLAHRDPESGVFWSQFLRPAGVRPAEAVCLQLTEALVESVKAGLGVGALARWAVKDALASGEIRALHLGRHGLRRSWYAATRRGQSDPATSALVSVLRTDALKVIKRMN